MKISIKRISALVLTQFKELHRDFGTVFLNLIFPVMFVFGLIATDLAHPTIQFKIGVVDEHQTQGARDFVQALTASPGMQIRTLSRDATQAALKNGDVHAVFIVDDAGFSTDQGKLRILVSPRFEGISGILLDAVRDRMRRQVDTHARVFDYQVSNPDIAVRSDLSFTFPGLLALAMVQLGLFATAVPMLQARDRGTLRYLSLTPLSMTEMLAGQLAVRVAIALLQVSLILLAGSTMLTITLLQWLQVFGISILGILLLVSIGYAIAGMAKSQQGGTAAILFLNFTMLIGGNVFMDPTGSSVQYFAACVIPISYLADLYRQAISGETGLWPVWLDVLVVLGATLVALTLALRTFRFDTDIRSRSVVAA
jgi:ABC-2 type transport system permease protein